MARTKQCLGPPKVIGRARFDLQNATWIPMPATSNASAPTPAPTTSSGRILIIIDDDDDVQKEYDQPFRFLDLPPELRNRIYNFTFTPNKTPHSDLTGPNTLQVVDAAPHNLLRNGNEWSGDNKSLFSLLQTCRQIYNEASEIPYINNYLMFEHAEDLSAFVGNATDQMLRAVRNVELELEGSSEPHRWGMLRFLPRLAKLRLTVKQPFCGYFLARPNDPILLKIKALGKLRELDVVVYSEEEEDEGSYEEDAVLLVRLLTSSTVRPK